METPLGSKWWPNGLWGEGDESGSTNWYTKPEIVMRALAMVTEGKAAKLGHDYTSSMPLFGERQFSLRIPGTPTGGAFGANKIMWNDEFLSTEVGQVGTQFDGLGHIGVQVGADGDKNEMRWYNGFSAQEMGNPYGLNFLGTEKLNPIIARGILLDIAAVRDAPMEAGDVVTMADVQAALEAQGMADYEPMPGDAILIRTGWERLWNDAPAFNNGCPGIGMEVARWIAETVQAGVTGFDTWPGDAVPNPGPRVRLLCPPVPADTARHREPGKPEAVRSCGPGRLPVRVLLQPGADQGRHWLDRFAGRDLVSSLDASRRV